MFKKININNDIVYYEHNDKYKTITVGTLILCPFTKEKLSERTIISSLVYKSNSKFPNEQDFSIYCQELYDLGMSSTVSRVGRTVAWRFSVNIINTKYIDQDMSLFNKAVDVLHTSIKSPNFTKENVEKEKRLYIKDLENVYNNKSKYALNQFFQHMFKDELYGINSLGELDEAKKVTLESVQTEYHRLLSSPRIFYVIGDIEEEFVKEAFKDFHFEKSSSTYYEMELIDKETKEIIEVQEIVETQNMTQSILCMGYRSNIYLDHPDHPAMLLFDGMLGHYYHSSLFQVIREQHSLAYYVTSSYNSRKGDLIINCAISSTSYEKVKQLVNEIIDDYQNGRFDDEILELTKIQLISQLKKQEDAASTIVPNLYSEIANLKIRTLEEKIELINQIKKDDIIKVARSIKLDTIYFLKGEADEEN